MDKRREAYYKGVTDMVRQRFTMERAAVIKAYRSGGMFEAETAIARNADEWAKLLKAVDQMVMEDFGNATFNQLKSDAESMEIKLIGALRDLFTVFTDSIQTWIADNVANKVVMIQDTTRKQIKERVEEGEKAGESIREIAERIDRLYLDDIIPNRSTVIARTEVISASNAGNREAAKQTELPLRKEWISTRDERTRDTHVSMDGKTADMDEPYQVPRKDGGTDLMQFPGDPKGSAANVIQCRCTEGYEVVK